MPRFSNVVVIRGSFMKKKKKKKKKKKVFLESKWEINLKHFFISSVLVCFSARGKEKEGEEGLSQVKSHNQKGFFRSRSDVALGRIELQFTNRPKKKSKFKNTLNFTLASSHTICACDEAFF